MENLTETIRNLAVAYGADVVGAIAILIIGRIAVGLLAGLVSKLMTRGRIDDTLNRFLTKLTRVLLLTFVVISALSALGVETTSFVAILGAAGLAVGFALKDSLGNFASGVMLIIFRPFRAGQFVEAGGTSGIIEEVGVFSTIMRTPDNREVVVPNSKITGDTITNYSKRETRRIDLVIGIGYDDDIRKAKTLLEKILREDSRVLSDPAPEVSVAELADSSVNFVVRPWVKAADYWRVRCDFTERIKLTFDEAGISIPYPQQDIHLYKAAG